MSTLNYQEELTLKLSDDFTEQLKPEDQPRFTRALQVQISKDLMLGKSHFSVDAVFGTGEIKMKVTADGEMRLQKILDWLKERMGADA